MTAYRPKEGETDRGLFLIDKSGNEIFPPEGTECVWFAEMAAGRIPIQDRSTGLYGYMDAEGKLAIAPIYQDAFNFVEGCACVQFAQGDWEHIDADGKVLLRGQKENYFFSHGLASIRADSDDTMIFIRRDGTEAFRITIEDLTWVGSFFENDCALYEVAHYDQGFHYAYGLLTETGRVLTPPVFSMDAVRSIGEREFAEGLMAVSALDLTIGYIDQTGNWILPPRYDNAGDFRDGLARVSVQGECLYIDQTGKVLFRQEEGQQLYHWE